MVVDIRKFLRYMFVFSKGKPTTTNLITDKQNKWAGTTNFGPKSDRDNR